MVGQGRGRDDGVSVWGRIRRRRVGTVKVDEGVRYKEGMGQAQSHSQHLPHPPHVLTPPHFFTPYPIHTLTPISTTIPNTLNLTPSPLTLPRRYPKVVLKWRGSSVGGVNVVMAVGLGDGREQSKPRMLARMGFGRPSVGMGCGCTLEWITMVTREDGDTMVRMGRGF